MFLVALMFFLGFGWRAVGVRRRRGDGDPADRPYRRPRHSCQHSGDKRFRCCRSTLVGLYLLGEVILYAVTALIGVWLFRLDFKNAILVGIGASRTCDVAYPIAQFAFPPDMTLPVRSIIAFDIIIFALSIVLLDVNSMAGRGWFRR